MEFAHSVFDPVVQLLLYFLHGWALLQTCRAIGDFDFSFLCFFFFQEEIVISQSYGNAAQRYNYQGRKVPWASQAACIWHHLISLALHFLNISHKKLKSFVMSLHDLCCLFTHLNFWQ